jgi:hypothetical protein
LGRAPIPLAPRGAIDNEFFRMADLAKFAHHRARSGTGFQPVSEDPTGKMPVLHKPAEPDCFEAKFALHSLVVDRGVVSSWSADLRRAMAHESGSPIGFLNVA